jgi:GT2 family glycosyltransferase
MSLPSVSVVIPTHNRRNALPPVIDAIASDPFVDEIIVVVDGSKDGTLEYLEQRSTVDARIKPVWQQNSGDRAARQRGIETAQGDVVLLLDDDVVAGPNLGEKHARLHERAEDRLVVGYMPTGKRTPRRAGDFATHLYADEYEKRCREYEKSPDEILQHLWSGNISLRREQALQVGFTKGEQVNRHTDQDFGLRCAEAGMTGVFDRSLASQHTHVRNIESFLRQARQYGMARRTLDAKLSEGERWGSPLASLPKPQAALVSVLAKPVLYKAWKPCAVAAIRVAGKLRVWKAETGLGRLARQVELVRGFSGLSD